MKRLVSAFLAIALGVVFAPQALAATTVQGGPLTGLSLATSTNIHLSLTGYPMTKGLYIEEAVKPMAGSRPSTSGTALWVSAAAADIAQHATPINGDLVLVVDNGHSWGADCAHQQCGIFIRLDHNSPGDLSEDQFIPLSFDASTAAATAPAPSTSAAPAAPALPGDTLVVTANGKALTENVPGAISYRTPLNFAVTTGSGATATIKSYTPDLCPVTGNVVDALKGSGACDIAVTSPGDAMHATKTTHFPLIVGPGVQSVSERITSVSIKYPMNLTQASNFGEAVSYKSTTPKICSTKGATVKGLKVGICVLTATAMGSKGNYGDLKQKVVLSIKY
jgi:hypothetical protein